MAHNLYFRQSLRLKEIFAGYGGFVTFVKSNAKALSTAVPSIESSPVFPVCPDIPAGTCLFLLPLVLFWICYILHDSPLHPVFSPIPTGLFLRHRSYPSKNIVGVEKITRMESVHFYSGNIQYHCFPRFTESISSSRLAFHSVLLLIPLASASSAIFF